MTGLFVFQVKVRKTSKKKSEDAVGAKDWVVIDDGEPGFNLEGLQSA